MLASRRAARTVIERSGTEIVVRPARRVARRGLLRAVIRRRALLEEHAGRYGLLVARRR